MKILNLYSGIGGNRKLWGDSHEITAVELNPEIAKIYSDFFPQDKMIVTDAHEYLLKHFKEYDFIWSSPVCISHSRVRKNTVVPTGQGKPVYPDMKLYEEIIFLQNYFKGLYCVENVTGYYQPLIMPIQIQRHYVWANFLINNIELPADGICKIGSTVKKYEEQIGLKISNYNIKSARKDQIMRNCVRPELGLHILNCAHGIYQHTKDVNQMSFINE